MIVLLGLLVAKDLNQVSGRSHELSRLRFNGGLPRASLCRGGVSAINDPQA